MSARFERWMSSMNGSSSFQCAASFSALSTCHDAMLTHGTTPTLASSLPPSRLGGCTSLEVLATPVAVVNHSIASQGSTHVRQWKAVP
jgi:hypothetical protein